MKKILRYEDLASYGANYTKVHIRRLEKDGRFPKRIRFSPYRVGWIEEEVIRWQMERIGERDAAA